MPRPRSSATELSQLFNAVAQPVYVVDGAGVIVFCNRACLEWLMESEEGVVGRRCAWHSQPDVPAGDALAAGLCPPPTVAAGVEITSTVTARGGQRRARFLPLRLAGDNCSAVLALVEADAGDGPSLPPPAAAVAAADEPSALELHHVIRRFRQEMAARYRADLLLGQSAVARRIRSQVELAAACRASVLIFGPTGSGREHVAQTIHWLSAGDSGALIPVACSLLSADQLQSTVAALAAKTPAPGQAGNSLVLGDADQLSLDVQAALLPLLAGRAGGLRLIATARRPLDDLVRHGAFREDLAGLLSTIVIELPPLVRRREDLPYFAQFFLEEANAAGSRQLAGFTAEALDRLDAYPWPGNSDELARVVTEAHGRAAGPEITVADLPQRIHWATDDAGHPRRKEETIVLDDFLGQVERELITRALARAKGNKAKAARLLGLTRPRLYRRMEQLGMEGPGG